MYTTLYYTILCYTILYYAILYYTLLYYTILYYNLREPSRRGFAERSGRTRTQTRLSHFELGKGDPKEGGSCIFQNEIAVS